MRADWRACFCPAIAVSAWGSLYVVSKPVLGVIPPFTLVLLRYLLALTVLLPLAIRICRRDGIRIARADRSNFLFIGIAGYGIATGAQFAGICLSSASVASLINSMNPVTIAIFAALLLGERLTRTRLAALAAVIAGAFVILGDQLASGQAAGIAVSLPAVCLWSLMSVRVRALSGKNPPLVITAAALLIAGICLIPVSAIELSYGFGNLSSWSWKLALPVLYMGLVCTALSQLLWNLGLCYLEASRCGLFYPLQPVISTILGVLILHEQISIRFLFGGALIIGGILCNIFSDKHTKTSRRNFL